MFGVPETEVAPGLTVFNKPLRFQEPHELASGDLRHAGHQDTPTVNSSTWTSFLF